MQWNMARAAAAAEAWDKAAEHARRAGDEDERNEILSWVASSMFFGPTPVAEGIRRCEEIRAEVVGNPGSEAWALRSLAGLHAMVGRFELARTLLAEANADLRGAGADPILLGFGSRRDRRAPGRRSRRRRRAPPRRIRCARENGRPGIPPDHGCVSGRGALRAGARRGRRPLTEISERLAAREDLLTQVVWRRVRAKVMARQGRIDEAEKLAQEAVTISESTDFLNTRADALVDLAQIHRRAGRLRRSDAQPSRRALLSTRRRATRRRRAERERTSGLAANVRRYGGEGVGALLELDFHELLRLGRMVARCGTSSTRFLLPNGDLLVEGPFETHGEVVDDVVVRFVIAATATTRALRHGDRGHLHWRSPAQNHDRISRRGRFSGTVSGSGPRGG